MQFTKQTLQGFSLGFRSGIHGSLSIVGESSDIANPDTVPIVVLTVSAHLFKGPTGLDRTIGRDDKVISAAFPAERAMQMVDVHHP